MSKYELLISESAPKGYPMEILDGSFYDSKGNGLYIPSGKQMHDGWGVEVSHHIVGDDKKRLPNRFEVLYFSYTENTFYQGAFALPEEKIADLFASGYYSPKLDDQITYRMIVIGVAPGGLISVWLKGVNKTTEVFSGKAEKTDVPWERVIETTKYTREGYVAQVLEWEIGSEGKKKLKQNGIPYGLWEKYRKRYRWTPAITGANMPRVLDSFHFFNGEDDYFSKHYGNDWSDAPKAVPRKLHFVWKHQSNKALSVKVEFDEEEIIQAFEELSQKSSQAIEFNIDISQVDKLIYYNFILRSGDEEIKLEKRKVEQYLSAKKGERLEKFLKEN